MKFECKTRIMVALAALCLAVLMIQAPSAIAQDPAPKAKGFSPFQMDERAEKRAYYFYERDNEVLEYCLFVSSKVSKDKKAPLIVSLHGLGAGAEIMMTKMAVDLAEAGGYILVAPMGYNVRGWYGIPMGKMPSFKIPPKSDSAAADAEAAPKKSIPSSEANTNAKTMPKGMAGLFSNANDPPNLRELSEKDVMNVLELVRREFNIDERRIYLTGHSMGGAGTLHLGFKYASIWAALAPVAPAAFGMDPSIMEKAKDMPVIFVHGDTDEAVPVANTRNWVEKAKEYNMPYEYNEMKDISHGPVITESQPSVYEFFARHSKPGAQ